MYKRLRIVHIKTSGLLGAGLFYASICILVGRPLIPYLFHTATGLCRPGCDASQICLSPLHLDFASALQASVTLLLLFPPGLFITIWMVVRYVGTRNARLTWV